MNKLNEIEFIANVMAQKDRCPRWRCLRDDLKEKYIKLAKNSVKTWAEGERYQIESAKKLDEKMSDLRGIKDIDLISEKGRIV